MSELRWIIAAIAALVIIGFYVSSRLRRAQDDRRFWADHELPDPDSVGDVTRTGGPDGSLAEDDLPHFSASRDDAPVMIDNEPVAEPESMTLIHYLIHPGGEFTGVEIYNAAQTAGLDFNGRDSLDFTDPTTGKPVFSLASAVGDGRIPKGELDSFTSSALVLYMELPGPRVGLKAYHQMLNVANVFVETFDTKVLDDARSTLTEQGMRLCQERIAEFDARTAAPPA